ncbi:MAG TPA: GYF domain-containing protein [Kofleriaceae bacterium]|nr:GYF domain-containing protein [Kofleriaceae bacterium]
MKFLCDRCKTRYSIADERVRGKILKIRCKNCSAVISVREGMDEPAEWAAPAPATAAAQAAVPSAPVRPPPASLHEEWYVSLDGNQEGPFLLPEAQAWVAAKASDDELHCWCEGFDDWLPVEKVSHFRGLRAKVTRARAPEPEPKPLFAATLAAIEADAEKDKAEKAEKAEKAAKAKATSPAPALAPTPAAAPAPAAAAALAPPLPGTAATPGTGNLPRLSPSALKQTPAAGQAKVNAPPIPAAAAKPGTPAAGLPKVAASALPLPATPPAPITAAAAAPRVGAGLPPVQALSGPGGATLPAASSSTSIPRPAPMFDTGPVEDGANGNGKSAAAPEADEPESDEPSRDPIDDIEDDLAIGEVSRVVRLADIAKALPARKAAAAPAAAAVAAAAAARNATASTAAIARGTGMVARVEPTEAGADVSPGTAGEASMYQALVAQPPRRRTLLYVGAAVVVLALVAIVVLVATGSSGDDDDQVAGTTRKYDDLGGTVDNPLVFRPGGSQDKGADGGVGPGTGSGGRRPTGSGGRPTGSGGNSGSQTSSGSGTGQQSSSIGPDGQPLRPLTPDDVFAMSSKMEIGTRRCYERALKDDPFLKVTKIKATVTVKNTGLVSNVSLSSMQGTPLATCLTAAIGRWRFRPSTEGIVSEFALVFEQR